MNKKAQIAIAGIIYLMSYRLGIIASGILSIYFGYRLYLSGLFPYAVEGSAFTAEIAGTAFSLQNAAPGTFFALFGVIVIVTMIMRSPPEFDFSTDKDGNVNIGIKDFDAGEEEEAMDTFTED